MDSEERSGRIKKKLSELVRAEKGSSEYDRLHMLLRLELEGATSIRLNGKFDFEAGCWAQSITDDDVAALVELLQEADISRLEKLDMSQNSLEERRIVALSRVLETGRFTSLTHLDLSETSYNVGMESSRAIAAALRTGHLSGFRHLSLPPCHVPTIAEALRLGAVSKLENVNLEGSRELEQRSNWLKEVLDAGLLSGVVHLSLRDCCLEADAVEVLAQAIELNSVSKLKHLDLSWNPLRQGGSLAIARLLRSGHLSNLKYLSLCKCEILEGGMRVISEAILERACRLEVLNVEENKIGDAGIADLLRALRSGHLAQLKTLMIRVNWIREEGMLALANFLQEGRYVGSLKEVHLCEVNVSERSARAFVSAYSVNEALTVELKKFRWPNRSFETNAEKYRKRNVAVASASNTLKDEKDVPATTGKVFLCGFQRVGKTTLRKSLQQGRLGGALCNSIISTCMSSRAEPRTRGIEVSQIVKKGKRGQSDVVLAMWDLAGQAEYRVLHSAFCLAEGKATIFVIVCNSNYVGPESEKELLFWLRFVASSCEQGIQRHVLVVLNCFHGRECSARPLWDILIQRQKDKFQDLLHICPTPFVLDARKPKSVVDLKTHLVALSQELLHGQFMPGICQNLPTHLDRWKSKPTNQKFPVLALEEFLRLFRNLRSDQAEQKLMAALEVLHEAGRVVFFRKDRLKLFDPEISVSGLVVLDPNWFCQRVVGDLLLPDSILEDEQSPVNSIAEPDGSIELLKFRTFLEQSLGSVEPVKWVVAMLMSLGLCYRARGDKVLVPALIKRDNMDKWERFGVRDEAADQWVMGRSLTLMDSEKTALPAALFRRLQVALAQDPDYESYTASKSSSNFKVRGMNVLLQFDVSENDPEKDRIDILVKPLGLMPGDPGNVRKQQLDLIEEIMDKLEPISICCCPGVQFHRKVILPWNAAKVTLSMRDRELEAVDIFKEKVELNGLGVKSNSCVDGKYVQYDDLLSSKDLEDLEKTIRSRCKGLEADVLELGIDIGDIKPYEPREVSVEELELLSPESSIIIRTIENQHALTRSEVRLQGQLTRSHFDRRMDKLQQSIQNTFDRQSQILRKVQAFHRYSLEEKASSLPRFLYLTKSSASGTWVTVKQAFVSTFHVHLLCESRFDDGYIHEVEGQEGVEIKNPKKWLRKIQAWLEWSLAIAVVVAKVVGAAALPGLGLLLPNLPFTEGSNLALLVESVATLGETALISGGHDVNARGSSWLQPINLKDRAMAAEMLKELMDAVGRAEFWEKMGLRKAVLRDTDGNPDKCAWICEKCYNCYSKNGILAAEITP